MSLVLACDASNVLVGLQNIHTHHKSTSLPYVLILCVLSDEMLYSRNNHIHHKDILLSHAEVPTWPQVPFCEEFVVRKSGDNMSIGRHWKHISF